MYSFIATHILARIRDLFRPKIVKYRKELEESQWGPREKILELQYRRLRRLLDYAYVNVPYYRNLFDERKLKPSDIQSTQDLVRLPVLTKQIIRDNFNDLIARDFPQKELVPSRTGGSTGEPLLFFGTKNDRHIWGYAASCRTRVWAGYKTGDNILWLSQIRPCKSAIQKWLQSSIQILSRTVVFNASEMSTDTIPLIAKKLWTFQPKFVRGYPSAIYFLAQFIESLGKPKIQPTAIITGGEQLYDYQRALIQKVFDCDVYSNYSSWEVNNIAAECSEHTGHHIAAENVIVEVVDDEGEPVPVGEEGRILVTNLHNYGMPFIRYDNGDVGAISDMACPCGRGLPLLTRLEGRSADVVRLRSGKSFPGAAMPWVFLASHGVEQFQIVQEDYDNVIVNLVVGKEPTTRYKDEIKSKVMDKYKPILGDKVNIAVAFVDQILPTEAGKRRIVISKLPPLS